MPPKSKPPGDLLDDAADFADRAGQFLNWFGGGNEDEDGPNRESDPEEDEEDGTEETEPVGSTDPPKTKPRAKTVHNVRAVVLVKAGSEERWKMQVDRMLAPLAAGRESEMMGIRNSIVQLIREACEENGNRLIDELA